VHYLEEIENIVKLEKQLQNTVEMYVLTLSFCTESLLGVFDIRGDYPAAIEMCLDCKNKINASPSLSQFHCVRGLSAQIQVNAKKRRLLSIHSHCYVVQEKYSVIQKKLHAALLEMCAKFQPDTYERVLIAYVAIYVHDRD